MKTCQTCKMSKDLNCFYADNSYKAGFQPRCRICVQKHRRDKKLGLIPPLFRSPTHKKCYNCNEIKENTYFYADKAGANGRSGMCKTCKNGFTMKWREDNKDHYNAYMRQANKEYYPRGRFLRYGITKEQHEAMLSAQEDRCYTCRKTNPSTKRCLAVDHNDASGVVRGILCYGCNRLLHAFDNVDKFLSIMNYLAKTDPNQYSLILESLNGTKLQSDRPND